MMGEFDAPQEHDPPSQARPHHVSARVPERVSKGVFSTGLIVMTGPMEFVLDFIQNLGQPAQVVARVIVPHVALPQFIDALGRNLEIYRQRFGNPPELPRPTPGERQPTAQEVYDELKIPDEVLVGAYANGVMIGHTAFEFKFDFLANMFPQSAVSCRIYLAAPQIPRILQSLVRTHEQYQQRSPHRRPDENLPPPPAPPETPGESP